MTEFAITNGKFRYCKPCKQKYDRDYWQKTKTHRNNRKKLNAAMIKERNFLFVYAVLESNPCTDCGEEDPIVLEFDHLDPATKSYNVSEMVGRGMSLKLIQAEIDKCEVVCSNCHRRRTARMFDYRRSRVLK